MGGICDGRVVIVTGAGRGIGREHALEFARQGARVVVNDLGTGREGNGRTGAPALEVVEEIRALGGQAVANSDDVADWGGAARLVKTALSAYGRLDVLVNNAGFLRDRTLVSMTEQEWDEVIRVHLKGHFLPLRHAGAHWRERSRSGAPVDARVINTSSGAGLFGGVGQGNHAAAAAGVVALTRVAAAELGRYGVTVNAIVPAARTRMTEEVPGGAEAGPGIGADIVEAGGGTGTGAAGAKGAVARAGGAAGVEVAGAGPGGGVLKAEAGDGFDAMDPANVAPLVAWLGSADSAHVTGRVFEVVGGTIALADGWRHGPRADRGGRWEPGEIADAVAGLLAEAAGAEPV
ncbi:SDR family NAD(P)-dependent oxidoreductase [Streptosporangium carneum]|uniref:Short-chain dehydrogenase/reductase n=1 Tax=Streptosporangium carneum TaxID=47481 RepID=A0A9W6I9T5_9ACTN|nr:SDR family NAD(P)-dependent oxidoreductase [Streptosporangium carneum]GLK14437.1 putative short-chain dehydrogenase/reductase [Streptosporangium carneum]